MTRRLPNLLADLSLLLCLAACVLWARSYGGSDYVSRARWEGSDPMSVTTRVLQITWTAGTVRLSDSHLTYDPRDTPVGPLPANWPAYWGWGRLGRGHVHWDDLPRATLWNRLGFYAGDGMGTSSSFMDERVRLLSFPAWLPAAALLALPAWRAGAAARARRRTRGNRCRSCDYDLTANVSGVCPECGTPAS
jgi:hypothetical protein